MSCSIEDVRSRVLKLVDFRESYHLEREGLRNIPCRYDVYIDDVMGHMAMALSARIFGGDPVKREFAVEFEFKHPATWVDALQLRLESKGRFYGGGLLGLILYWWFLNRTVKMVTERQVKVITVTAQELFPKLTAEPGQDRIVYMEASRPSFKDYLKCSGGK